MRKAAYPGCVLRTLNRPRGQEYTTVQDANTESLSFPIESQMAAATVDPLTAVLRRGARDLLIQAVDAEVGAWIAERLSGGLQPQEIGVFVRSQSQMKRARAVLKASGAQGVELSDKVETTAGRASISTMHLAKGL